MPHKNDKLKETEIISIMASNNTELSYETFLSEPIPQTLSVSFEFDGEAPGAGEFLFIVIFNGQVILDTKWQANQAYGIDELPFNLKEPSCQEALADKPLIVLLRSQGGKPAKDPDPLLHHDNRAGASIDLFPLVLGEPQIFIHVPLLNLNTGLRSGTSVHVNVRISEPYEPDLSKVPLTITMISGHCFPLSAREGTVFIAAIGLDEVLEPESVSFEMSLSTFDAEKFVWATASSSGYAANTDTHIFDDDVFVPQVLLKHHSECRNVYWNAVKRVLVDPELLKSRLSKKIFLEIAGVPKTGKIDVRGRYMGYIDAGALLEPDQLNLTTCALLFNYNEDDLPPNQGALLELPPTSAKQSARTARDPSDSSVLDEQGHPSFVILRFDLTETLVPKEKMAMLYETMGVVQPEGPCAPVDELEIEPPPENTIVDVGRVRKEGGALAVHKELSTLACMGTVPMNQGIKRTAANRLLMRVRTMLKQFPPGECSYIEWQDTVTGQHAACRRAVTASFAPQPPPFRPPSRFAAARSRIAGDTRISDLHIRNNLEYSSKHSRSLICKALRCLEEGDNSGAKKYIMEGLLAQPRNRFLLWMLGAQEFDNGETGANRAAAALRIAVKGDYSDTTANAIGWAALHTLQHSNGNYYAAFVAAKRMRKSYELRRDWKKFHQRWVNTSGEEEIFWVPESVDSSNPFLIAAAFFLCLRCFKFSKVILNCVENGCAVALYSKSHKRLKHKPTVDTFYLRAASLLQQRKFGEALKNTAQGIKNFGPSAIMSQMQATSLICSRGWDRQCQAAIEEAEKAGVTFNPMILLKAAAGTFIAEPQRAMQWAARAHKLAPCAHSALMIGRIYARMGDDNLAERWAAAAVKSEPLLADGWAVLALIAMYKRDVDKARTMLRTARQAGPLSPDVEDEVNRVLETADIEILPDALVKNLCFCDLY